MARIATVHTVGPLMAHLNAALPGAIRGLHVDTAEEMVSGPAADARARGCVADKKAPRGSKVSRVVDAPAQTGASGGRAQARGPARCCIG